MQRGKGVTILSGRALKRNSTEELLRVLICFDLVIPISRLMPENGSGLAELLEDYEQHRATGQGRDCVVAW